MQLDQVKQYPKIPNNGSKGTKIPKGERIVVMEKVGGESVSFVRLGDEMFAFVNGSQIHEGPFFDFVQALKLEDFEEDLVYFGDWIEEVNEFYLCDIYDASIDGWGGFIDYLYVMIEASLVGLRTSPIVYAGPFISPKHIKSLVGSKGLILKNFKTQQFVKYLPEEVN